MIIQLRGWVFVTLLVCLLTAIITIGVLFHQKKETEAYLTKKVEYLSYSYKALKKNRESEVKPAAEKFIRAFFESDSEKSKPVNERIKPYVTEKARQQISVPGANEVNQKDFPIHIVTKIKDLKVYYTYISPDRASVFATANREVSVEDNKPVVSYTTIEVELILQNGKWIVHDVKLEDADDY
ncbi:hypothetical protein [Priestia megaterium]|uniref:hypothetical protein n=1 Tax=Priestia megaterium TaxID=1404 RepID=UPI002E25012E|nr:hypothetical protein [Priestia megaterium]